MSSKSSSPRKGHRHRNAATALRKTASVPGLDFVDYKDVATLRRFLSEKGKIRSRGFTGLSPRQQRKVATAIKNAREMALLPYPGGRHPE
jgi:small subunit ribosomal protein S18